MIINTMKNTRMGNTGRGLTHERGPLQHFQVIAKLLRAGGSSGRRQYIDRLVGKPSA